MAERTPSMVPTSSSRIVVGFVGAEVGGAGTGEIEGHADGAPADDGRGGAVQVVMDLGPVACRGGNVVVINERVPSATALTFSIRNSYRHSRARLERFMVWFP